MATLNDATVILTGAAGGIGKALTRGLLQQGAKVFAVDREQGALDQLAGAHPDYADRLWTCAIDLALDPSTSEVIRLAQDSFGSVTAVVANAGIGKVAYTNNVTRSAPPVWQVPLGMWRQFFDVNTLAPIRLINELAPQLLRTPNARVITVTTSLRSMTRAGAGPYGPSKAALEAFTSVLAHEAQGSTLTANVLVPGGPVDTAMVPEEEHHLRSELIQPEAMVAPLVWLLSAAGSQANGRRIVASEWQEGDDSAGTERAGMSRIAW